MRSLNPIIRGWINHYSALPAILLISVLRHIDHHSVKWVSGSERAVGT